MNCLEFRRRVGAEPRLTDADLDAHAQSCSACAAYRRQLLALDERIEAALKIPVPKDSGLKRAVGAPAAPFALAASVLLAAALATVLWLAAPRTSLASDIARHIAHESNSWSASEQLPESRLSEISNRAGVAIDPAIGTVTYAQACWFRGQWVPHLVVLDASGPVTVLVLSQERDVRRERFSEGGYHGVIIPARHGAIAVLSRDDARVDAVAEQALRAVQ